MVGTPPNTTPALTSDGKPRQVALYQILISTGIMDILHGLEAVHLQPQLEGQAPGHLSKEKHPVLVFLSRRLITGELKGYRGKADGLSLLLGSMGAQLIGHAQAGRPLQLTGMQRKGGPSVYLPATAVQAVATEISKNPQWMAYIKSWNRVVGGVRAARVKRTAKKAEQGGSSGSGGGGGGWRGYFGQGGRRKRTRKHKKKKKRTRRHKYRHKRTRHHRRKKKHTRKH
jgi:hypothetical protein